MGLIVYELLAVWAELAPIIAPVKRPVAFFAIEARGFLNIININRNRQLENDLPFTPVTINNCFAIVKVNI